MKNKFAAIAIASIIVLSLSGCGSSAVADAETTQDLNTMFERHKIDEHSAILVDKSNGVCYLEAHYSGGYSGITVMLNDDGTPKIWEEN